MVNNLVRINFFTRSNNHIDEGSLPKTIFYDRFIPILSYQFMHS